MCSMLKIPGLGLAQLALGPGPLCSGRASSAAIKANTKHRSFASCLPINCTRWLCQSSPFEEWYVVYTQATSVPPASCHALCFLSDPLGGRSQEPKRRACILITLDKGWLVSGRLLMWFLQRTLYPIVYSGGFKSTL